MPQRVDAYRLMISKQRAFYNQMTKGVVTFCHNVYTQDTEIILQSQIFAANVKGQMAVIAAKDFQNYKNLRDTFKTQNTSNNCAWARMAAVLRERQGTENALAKTLEAQRLWMEEHRMNAKRAMASVQNTECMEIEDNKKKAEEDLKKQGLYLASIKREMTANKKQWQQTFAQFQK